MAPLTSICVASIITGAISFADELHKGLLKQQYWKTKKRKTGNDKGLAKLPGWCPRGKHEYAQCQ